MTVYDSFIAWIDTFLACFGGCLGCDAKGSYPTKEEQIAERYSLSEDFWGTSSGFLDVPIDFSKRSNSTLSLSNPNFHSDIGSVNTNSRGEFINPGLLLWNQNRFQWIGATSSTNDSCQDQEPANSQSPVTCDSFLRSKDQLRRIPLSEMVEFLVDTWEHEGLYD